jgi:threonine dehydrogenase-like Zn-dependent dehydrogenase
MDPAELAFLQSSGPQLRFHADQVIHRHRVHPRRQVDGGSPTGDTLPRLAKHIRQARQQGTRRMSTTVRAIAISPSKPNSLHLTTLPLDEPAHGQVELEVIRVGVCGTDRELIRGEIGHPPAGQDELVLGHEVVGRVSKVGAGVDKVQVGDLATVTVRRPDDCPACRAGEPDMCLTLQYTERGIAGAHGFMAERIIEDQQWVIPVPAHLEATAMLVEPLTVVEKAVRQAELIQRRLNYWEPKTAIVMGAGPIGLLGTLLLRSKGVEVWTVARTPAPTPAATIVEGCGATYVSSRQQSLADLAASLPNVDLVLESSGSSQVVFESMQLLGNNGVLVLLSLTGGEEHHPVPTAQLNTSLVAGNKVVVGSVNAGMVDFVNAVESLDRFEQLWPGLTASMITHRFTPDDDLETATSNLPGGIKSVIEFTR